jgi:sarcosine oxidase
MRHDVVVIGLGAMGSATTYALAQRGVRVIGIDRFKPPHDRGSSHGESRVIRIAYFEDPAYVPLLQLAFDYWRRFESHTGERVLTITGIIEAGYKGAPLVEGSVRSAVEHGLPHEVLRPSEANLRFPALSLPPDWDCVFQPDGGVLRPEKAIQLFLCAAKELGAQLRLNTVVRSVQPIADHVEVQLESGEIIEAGSVVLCAGPWISEIIPELRSHLVLTRQPLVWFRPRDQELVRADRMPVFFLQTKDDLVYGFPDLFGTGVKVASHLSGGELPGPGAQRSEVSDEEKEHLGTVLKRYIPAASGDPYRATTCIYTRAPDGHFVLGLHPRHPQIVIASPCSGHGFKFASVFGEVLADLATRQTTDKPIDLFRPGRFMDPDERNLSS